MTIKSKINIENISIEKLIPYARNTKTHPETQIAQIAASIKEFGFNNPVLINKDNQIIAGHGRVEGARKLGMDAVPCVRLEHLTKTQQKAYGIVDNQLTLNSPFDDEMLKLEIEELDDLEFNLDLLGFDKDYIEDLLHGGNFEPGTEDEQGKLDELKPMFCKCPECGKEFNARETEIKA